MGWPFKKTRAERTAEEAKAAQATRLDTLLALGNEEEFVKMIKAANPKITPERLLGLIEQFRAIRRQKTGRAV